MRSELNEKFNGGRWDDRKDESATQQKLQEGVNWYEMTYKLLNEIFIQRRRKGVICIFFCFLILIFRMDLTLTRSRYLFDSYKFYCVNHTKDDILLHVFGSFIEFWVNRYLRILLFSYLLWVILKRSNLGGCS